MSDEGGGVVDTDLEDCFSRLQVTSTEAAPVITSQPAYGTESEEE